MKYNWIDRWPSWEHWNWILTKWICSYNQRTKPLITNSLGPHIDTFPEKALSKDWNARKSTWTSSLDWNNEEVPPFRISILSESPLISCTGTQDFTQVFFSHKLPTTLTIKYLHFILYNIPVAQYAITGFAPEPPSWQPSFLEWLPFRSGPCLRWPFPPLILPKQCSGMPVLVSCLCEITTGNKREDLSWWLLVANDSGNWEMHPTTSLMKSMDCFSDKIVKTASKQNSFN